MAGARVATDRFHYHGDETGSGARVFDIGAEVPAEIVARVGKHLFADDDPDEDETDHLDEPPRSGPGSGKEAWRAHAERLGLSVPDGANREDIVALVDQHRAAQD